VIAERTDGVTWQSLRNVHEVHLLEPGQLNTYDVLVSDEVVFTRSALDVFLAGPAKGKSAKGAASSDEVEVEVEVATAPVEVTKKSPAKKAAAKAVEVEPTADAADDVTDAPDAEAADIEKEES
jgi:large subunit ribosomal protein L4